MADPVALTELFQPDSGFTILESGGSVGGNAVLAKVRGEFFFPGGISRNGRYYSPQLWERVLEDEELTERIQHRQMLGTISHNQTLDDEAVLEGKVSHIVSDLRIEDGKGIGEALILDTPAGRILNTLFRAGSKLYVSSRADGEYEGTHKGVPRVKEDSYTLKTFDFVLDPGFLQASPQLAESLNEDFQEVFGESLPVTDEGESDAPSDANGPLPTGGKMGDENKDQGGSNPLLEAVYREKSSLETKLSDALDEVQDRDSKIAVRDDKLAAKDTEIANLQEKVQAGESSKAELDDLKAKIEAAGGLEQVESMNGETKPKIDTIIEKAGDLDTALSMIEHSIRVTERFGTEEQMEEAYDLMDAAGAQITEMGPTLEHIRRSLEYAEHMAEQVTEANAKAAAGKLAEELGVSAEVVLPMLQRGMSEDEVRQTYAKITEAAGSRSKYKAPPLDEGNTGDGDSKTGKLGNRLFEQPSGRRLQESITGNRGE